jgi:hypothetical protein
MTGYPWSSGEPLLAADLNAAIANSVAISGVLPLSGGTMTGPLNLPGGALAIPSLQFGAADGTGISRSGTAVSIGIGGVLSASFFANSMQSYGQLFMLGNKIVQVADATAATDALNLRTADARYLPLTVTLVNAANDAAAATAGVPVGGFYRIGNAVQVRLV